MTIAETIFFTALGILGLVTPLMGYYTLKENYYFETVFWFIVSAVSLIGSHAGFVG